MHVGRRGTLDACDVFGVVCELEQEVRLSMPRKLRVLDLVVPSPAAAGARFGDLAQEVRVPKTDAVEERRLMDNLVAALHRGFGLRGGAPDPSNPGPRSILLDLPAFGKQPPEVILLVLIAELR